MADVTMTPQKRAWSLTGSMTIIVLLLLAIIPPLAKVSGFDFYLDLATRLVCLAIAAVSLNLILGYGGMVSFGHAAYIGIGAYAVGIVTIHSLSRQQPPGTASYSLASSSQNTSSSLSPSTWANVRASPTEGTIRSFSTAIMVCRDTPAASANAR